MGKKLEQRFVLSDESVNRYGFRVLTSGMNLKIFQKNPIMLWMHFRDEGSKEWCDYKPIGHWEDIEVDDKQQLTARPYFDLTDDLSKMVCSKVEEGTVRATSIGFKPVSLSDDPKYILPGQTRATVVTSDVLEASFCDIPANANAVRLFSDSVGLSLTAGSIDDIPLINKPKPMKLKNSLLAILAFLGIATEKAAETELSEDQLSQINDEMARLRTLTEDKDREIDRLKSEHSAALSAKDEQIRALNETHLSELTEKDNVISGLQAQIDALKSNPSPAPSPTPKKEPLSLGGTALDQLAAFSSEHSTSEIIAEGKRLGIF